MAEGINGQADDDGNANASACAQNGDMNHRSPLTNGSLENKVCRDFLRKVCYRGARCKFIHPEEDRVEEVEPPVAKRELTFCHDYQNGFCPRSSCRFMHCSYGEENYYIKTGHILPHIMVQATMKGQISDATSGEAPICKDFLMGDCARKRGGKCRFRHLTKVQFEQEAIGRSDYPSIHSRADFPDDDLPILPEAKRLRYDPCGHIAYHRERELKRSIEEATRIDITSREICLREFRDREREIERERDRRGIEEILLLRKQLDTLTKEIASLKKENSDLRATNDFLLEKVTTMSKGAGTVTTVTVPTVSLASTIPVATSVRPLTAAQVSHPLSITSEVGSVGSVVTMQPAPPQPQPALAPPTQQVAVAQPTAAVIGSVGGVQVSLSQPPALTAVTLHTSMSPSIAPTIAPTPTNLSQAMSMSGASAHLVSYPIMTQPVLRPQLL